jgi:hypothetical protein
MFQLEAPYPSLQVTSLLPNPKFSDQEASLTSMMRKSAIDGTRYTYVKRKNNRRKLHWTFQVSRNKGLEIRDFINLYFASKIRITDHNSRIWIGNFINNPFELVGDSKASPTILPLPKGELMTLELEFEGIEQ